MMELILYAYFYHFFLVTTARDMISVENDCNSSEINHFFSQSAKAKRGGLVRQASDTSRCSLLAFISSK